MAFCACVLTSATGAVRRGPKETMWKDGTCPATAPWFASSLCRIFDPFENTSTKVSRAVSLFWKCFYSIRLSWEYKSVKFDKKGLKKALSFFKALRF